MKLAGKEDISITPQLIGQKGELIPKPVPQNFEYITLSKDKPTVIRPSDFRIGRVESGFSGEPPDVFLYINASSVAGDGPTTQALQASEGLKRIAQYLGKPIYYVGPDYNGSDIAESDWTGSLPDQLTSIPSNSASIQEKYDDVTNGLIETVNILGQKGVKKIIAVSTGYTGFVHYGFKEALVIANKNGFNINAKLIIQDSSLPDTDKPSEILDKINGHPIDRFYPKSYESDENLEVWLITNNWLDFNIKWVRNRAPKGTLSASSSFPFTPEYIRRWQQWRQVSKEEAREKLIALTASKNPQFAQGLLTEDAVFIPLIASSGYFNPDSIGKWMTEDQFNDVITGSRTLVNSLLLTSDKVKRPIILSGVENFVNYINSLRIPYVEELGDHKNSGKVLLVRAPRFPQSEYGLYHRAADVSIHRTTQANTSAEGVIAGVPQIILTMPGNGYMDTQKMDKGAYIRGLRQYEVGVSTEKLADRITGIINDPGESASLVDLADTYFLQEHMNPGTNFFSVVGHISGIPIPGFPNENTVFKSNHSK